MRQRPSKGDVNGAFGDLGTLLPYTIGAITVGGLSVVSVFFGFGAFLIASGLFYGFPMAVQPMKAVTAALLTSSLGPGEIAATGVVLGALFLLLGLTGGIAWIARAIPQSVTTGLVLGLGFAMALIGLDLMLAQPLLGFGALAFFLAASRITGLPILPAALLLSLLMPVALGTVDTARLASFDIALPPLVMPQFSDLGRVLELAVLPQIPLTIANAIIVTAAVSRSCFPETSSLATERHLSVTTGLGNLLLAPFGALPMCHGAGGVVAQARFGATTAAAPVLLGALLLVLALTYGEPFARLLEAFPLSIAGALLVIAGADLAITKRLFDARPDCWPVIAATALCAAFVSPALAVVLGLSMEIARRHVIRQRRRRNSR